MVFSRDFTIPEPKGKLYLIMGAMGAMFAWKFAPGGQIFKEGGKFPVTLARPQIFSQVTLGKMKILKLFVSIYS